jgi:hypothetical protein
MILLLRYSGLRISDAAVLARERLERDKLSLRTIKTGSNVSVRYQRESFERSLILPAMTNGSSSGTVAANRHQP